MNTQSPEFTNISDHSLGVEHKGLNSKVADSSEGVTLQLCTTAAHGLTV
jgi:hypothetical protein